MDIDGSTIYKHLQKLKVDKSIIIESNNQYSIITISNYNSYNSLEELQSNNQVTTKEQPSSKQGTSKGQASNTKNKVNKDKKVKQDINIDFEDWWQLYNKEIDKEASEKVWIKLTDAERQTAFNHTPEYVKSTPDKTYRKSPLKYLKNKNFYDEIILNNPIKPHGKSNGIIETKDAAEFTEQH